MREARAVLTHEPVGMVLCEDSLIDGSYRDLLPVARFARGDVPVVVVENNRGFKALGRSWTLVAGGWWKLFGAVFFTGVFVGIVAAVAVVPLPPFLTKVPAMDVPSPQLDSSLCNSGWFCRSR